MAEPEATSRDELILACQWVIVTFDQANTGGAIEGKGSRGRELAACVRDLRAELVKRGVNTYPPGDTGDWVEGGA